MMYEANCKCFESEDCISEWYVSVYVIGEIYFLTNSVLIILMVNVMLVRRAL